MLIAGIKKEIGVCFFSFLIYLPRFLKIYFINLFKNGLLVLLILCIVRVCFLSIWLSFTHLFETFQVRRLKKQV